MEKTILNIEVPANLRRVLNIPELIGVDLSHISVMVSGKPQKISRTEIEGRFMVEFLGVEPGRCVDLLFSQNTSDTRDISVVENDILSVSIPDMSAIRALPLIGEQQFSCYTGSQFGLFLAVLLAAGISAKQLSQALATYGLKMFHFRLFEKRNRFSGLEDFCRKLLPNVDLMTMKDLMSETFIPVVNGSSGKESFITRSSQPDFPLLSAIKCAVASLMDYVPLRTDNENTGNDDAFSDRGLIWSYSAFSYGCPDLTLYRYLRNRKLSFTTYASYPLLSYKAPKLIKNHKHVASHYQADEIGKRIYLEDVAAIMPELVSDYRFTLLEPMPVLNYVDRDQMQLLLSGV